MATNDKAEFSFADELARREAAESAAQTKSNEAQARADQLVRDGYNPLLAYVEQAKPQDTRDEEARMRRAAKISAWGDFAGALGSGITGVATSGWQPTLNNDRSMKMLNQAEQIKAQRSTDDKEHQKLQLNALLQQAQGEQGIAANAATRARAEYDTARQSTQELVKSEQARQAQMQKLAMQMQMSQMTEAQKQQYRMELAGYKSDLDMNKDNLLLTYPDGSRRYTNKGDEANLLALGESWGIIPKRGTPIASSDPDDPDAEMFDFNKLPYQYKIQLLNQVVAKQNEMERQNYTAGLRQQTNYWGEPTSDNWVADAIMNTGRYLPSSEEQAAMSSLIPQLTPSEKTFLQSPIMQQYIRNGGDPIGAMQQLIAEREQ